MNGIVSQNLAIKTCFINFISKLLLNLQNYIVWCGCKVYRDTIYEKSSISKLKPVIIPSK